MYNRRNWTMAELEAINNKGFQPNQLHPELLSVNSLNPVPGTDSSSRAQMMASQIGQSLVIKGATKRILQTGLEREFGKYTFNVKMPEDGHILYIVERYTTTGLSEDRIKVNPQTVVIYEGANSRVIGMISLTGFCSNHTYFGFQYQNGGSIHRLTPGAFIKEGAVFLESPNVDENGDYKLGIELNVAFMTHPATSEDSILICSDVLPKLRYNTYETRVVEWGKDAFALNLYGDEKNYRPFPDIGDPIREDGVLMALREYEPSILSPAYMSVKDCMSIDFMFDKTVYAAGAGGEVVDVIVHHDADSVSRSPLTDTQALKYHMARKKFYEKILEINRTLSKRLGNSLQLTPEFHSLVVEAISVAQERKGNRGPLEETKTNQKVRKIFRQNRIDRFFVEFVIKYTFTPNLGGKLTDLHGGKGVICQIEPPENMPVDSMGNRADIIADPNGTVARMNPGRAYEQYLTAASRDAHRLICSELGTTPHTDEQYLVAATRDAHRLICSELGIAPYTDVDTAESILQGMDLTRVTAAWMRLKHFYGLTNPMVEEWYDSGRIGKNIHNTLAVVIANGIYLYMPTDNQKEIMDVIKDLEASPYRPTYGPVTYVGNSGKKVTTIKPVRIGSIYVISLEKDGRDWNAISSSKIQHHGVPAQLTKMDKYDKPTRAQATRTTAEAEIRVIVSDCDGELAAEIIDRSNSSLSHEAIAMNILTAKKPTNIEQAVDRNLIPLGTARPLQMVKHICETGGFQFAYKEYNQALEKNQPPTVSGAAGSEKQMKKDQRDKQSNFYKGENS